MCVHVHPDSESDNYSVIQNYYSMKVDQHLPSGVSKLVLMSISHEVGCGFLVGHTKDHYTNDTNFLPAWQAGTR